MELGPLLFSAPWALVALATLPVIWWLLRLTPPAPRLERFPPFRLLLDLVTDEKSAAKTPPWLILLRLLLAALVILAAAHPLLRADGGPETAGGSRRALLIVVDDGWAASEGWDRRRSYLTALTERAKRASQPVALLTTAPVSPGAKRRALSQGSAAAMGKLASAIRPKPWPTDRAASLEALAASALVEGDGVAEVVWLSDGIGGPAAGAFADALTGLGPLTVVEPAAGAIPLLVRPPVIEGGVLTLTVERAEPGLEVAVGVRARAEDGRIVAREDAQFEAGETTVDLRFELPSDRLNQLESIDLAGQPTAGGTVLMDERWRRRPVGLVSSAGGAELPLLSARYYLRRALEPFTELREGRLRDLLAKPLAVAVLADPGRLGFKDRAAIEKWMAEGGVAVRFAGPLLASSSGPEALSGPRLQRPAEPLLPVPLRGGDRNIGGAMSWSQPATLAPFAASSPFFGLQVPGDVVVRRQVLAQPAVVKLENIWARLTDGTPLVTAAKRGDGWLVLVHTTANTQWSNLALSGLFVDMLERLVALSQGVTALDAGPPLEPIETLGADGRLGPAPADAEAIKRGAFPETAVSAAHPPGFYGQGKDRRALNLGAGDEAFEAISGLPADVIRTGYGLTPAKDLRGMLLVLATLLLLVDLFVSLAFRGLLSSRQLASARANGAALGVLLVLSGVMFLRPGMALAIDDADAIERSAETRIAYVLTGDSQIDEVSRQGLTGLSLVVKRRTAAELAPPKAVDPRSDELAFFPLLYWPVTEGAAGLAGEARGRLNAYLKNGGTILFDTRDRSGGASGEELKALAEFLDIPPLVPVPAQHVLTRAFYLLQDFPGRWTGGTLWVEQAGERVNDGVSPVIAGSHDWAAAWALDDVSQQPVFPVVPGGERQREMAFRFGINLVMYTLTGNYKADQVHLPAIIQRLGQ